jgi:hypothetical protein
MPYCMKLAPTLGDLIARLQARRSQADRPVDDALKLLPNSLLIFVDETGNEDLSDPKNPTFGRGGCGALFTEYKHRILNPWKGGVRVTEVRLYAARPPSRERRSIPRGRATQPRQQSASTTPATDQRRRSSLAPGRLRARTSVSPQATARESRREIPRNKHR